MNSRISRIPQPPERRGWKAIFLLSTIFILMLSCGNDAHNGNNGVTQASIAFSESDAEFVFSLVNIEGARETSLALTGTAGLQLARPGRLPHLEFEMAQYGKDYDAKHAVSYIPASDLPKYELDFSPDGRVLISGKPIKPGSYIFVMDKSGKIYAGTQKIGSFHHSSFLNGKPVSAGGHLFIDTDGRLHAINNMTGHYQLPGATNRQFINELASRNVNLKNVMVGEYVGDPQQALYRQESVRAGIFSPPLDIDSLSEKRMLRQEHIDGSITEKMPDGSKTTTYPNGNRLIEWHNNGVKQIVYSSGTVKNIYPNGLEEIRWINGAIESKLPDNTKYLRFPDGSIRTVFPDGKTIHELANKVQITEFPDGTKQIRQPGGEVENIDKQGIITKDMQDGVVSRRFPNGVFEVRFPDGLSEITLKDGTKVHKFERVSYKTKSIEQPLTKNKLPAIASLDEIERLKYEAFITDDGRFVNYEGKTINSSLDNGIFVMDKDGRIFIGEHKSLQFHHSSFLAGGNTAASGHIHIKNGRLIKLDNNSAHYKDPISNRKLIKELNNRGLTPTNVRVGNVTDFDSQPRKLDYKNQKIGAVKSFEPKIDLEYDPNKPMTAEFGNHRRTSLSDMNTRNTRMTGGGGGCTKKRILGCLIK